MILLFLLLSIFSFSNLEAKYSKYKPYWNKPDGEDTESDSDWNSYWNKTRKDRRRSGR